jgi:hypothetical protein
VIRLRASLVLAGTLSVTACFDDTDAQDTTSAASTGLTAVTGSGGTVASSTTGNTTVSGVTMGTTAGGSAGEGQGGTAGDGASGAGGASGADAGGAGGEAGAAGECVPALHALVRAIFGDFDCPELEACFVESCPDELAAAMGDGWASGDHSGGICSSYADCVEECDCESECSLECRDEHAGGGACLDAVIEVSLCRNDACPAAADSCAP